MNNIKTLIITLLFFLLVSCGSHKRGASVPFPENGVVAQIIQLDERTAQLELNWYGGGMSELIIRDSGRGPLFKAVVPSTNTVNPDLGVGFVLVDCKARRIYVFVCEVSVVLDFIVGSDPRLDQVTQVETLYDDGHGIAYFTGARVLNITGVYKIDKLEMVPKWMINHPLKVDGPLDGPENKWYEKYYAK